MPAQSSQRMTLSDLGEFGFIDRIKKSVGKSSVICGIGDDTAVVPFTSEKFLLLTTDMLIEGEHFTKKMEARAIGHKAIAASISDIAAMGGYPKYALISLGAPASCSWQFMEHVYQGMHKTAKKFGVQLIGGDTVKNSKIIINVALVGEVKKKEVVYRSGARQGDQIFVTGPLGRSLLSQHHLNFIPRIAHAQYLVKKAKPTAMIDISDGLAADLKHILKQSRVGAILEEDQIPCRKGARLKEALHDGEDFELLFTVSPSSAKKLKRQKNSKLKFYHIGEIVSSRKGFQIRTSAGAMKRVDQKGYTHF